MLIEQIEEYIREKDSRFNVYPIKNENIIFENRVKLNCFYCKKYNQKWTCPPRIPDIDYVELLREYDRLAIIQYTSPVTKDTYSQIRQSSTNDLHKILLKLEKYLYENNNSLAVSFIGGSCKLCKNDCDTERCRNPHLARIPIEALGINVVKSLENIGINVEFPLKDIFYRFGLIAW